MRPLLRMLRKLRDNKRGSVPLQYAIVVAGTALATMVIVETASRRIADKFNAVASALNKVQF